MNTTKLDLFTFYTSPLLEKKRIGSNNDGGYVIISNANLINCDIILSGGAGNNTKFEVELSQIIKQKCYIFDHSITKLRHSNNWITFLKQKIDKNNQILFQIINQHQNIFLKLDIEGHEFEFINELSTDQLNNFKQIIVEFHNVATDFKLNQLKKIRDTHIPVHVHINNCGSSFLLDKVLIPKFIEITFIRKIDLEQKILNTLYLNNQKLPLKIDKKNCPKKNDILIDYYPFCIDKNLDAWTQVFS